MEDTTRGFIVFIPQLVLATMFLGLAFLVLKRNKTRLSITLSGFYIVTAIGLIFNAIFLLATNLEPQNELLLVLLYFVGTSFPLIYAFAFLVMFIVSLLRIELEFSLKKEILFLVLYGICDIIVFLFPGGITLVEAIGWRPIYSWEFLIVIYIYFTLSIIIPTIFFSSKLMKGFEAKNLKKRIRFFIIGIYTVFISFYGGVLYNTWQETIFKSIWAFISLGLLIFSAISIYYGIGYRL